MDQGPFTAILPGGRLHLQHGPIDLIIKAEGEKNAIKTAYRLAERRFQTVLSELVAELPLLKQTVSENRIPGSAVARRMWHATSKFSRYFITPMSAVAGSVADEILHEMTQDTSGLAKVFVNNGGDIALWKNDEETFAIEIATLPDLQSQAGKRPIIINIGQSDQIGGLATSGRHGRSLSLGIADSVTVLAKNAAIADAAATLIANAIDIDSNKVRRLPASEIELDSDLGEQLVTVSVERLDENECDRALTQGLKQAGEFLHPGFLDSAFLFLQDHFACIPDDVALATNSSTAKAEVLSVAG